MVLEGLPYQHFLDFCVKGKKLTALVATAPKKDFLKKIIESQMTLSFFSTREGDLTLIFLGASFPFSLDDFNNKIEIPALFTMPFDESKDLGPWTSELNASATFHKFTVVARESSEELTIYKISGLTDLVTKETNQLPKNLQHDTKESWNHKVKRILQAIGELKVKKIVLSRTKESSLTTPPRELLKRAIETKRDNHYIFYHELRDHEVFISLSPECLLKIDQHGLYTEALAGTIPLHIETKSAKDMTEHEIVVTEIINCLKSIDAHILTVEKTEEVVLKNFKHLRTKIRAKAESPLKEIIRVMHPTPALGGSPKNIALNLIRELENYDRGLFGAPIGILGPHTELLVGIRSALIQSPKMTLFAGAGIVSGSIGDEEWEETSKKMQTIELLT